MKFSIASKTFGTRKVLGPIQLELHKRTATALMGPSGSGKTTLLRLIAGLERDDAGTKQPHIKIGMMFQEPNLLPWKTAIENIEIAGPENGLLKYVNLENAAHLYPRQLSLGMARRVAFARALACKPDLLILDEPFASLDSELVELMQSKINTLLLTFDAPILMTTHMEADAKAINATILRLDGSPAVLQPRTQVGKTDE